MNFFKVLTCLTFLIFSFHSIAGEFTGAGKYIEMLSENNFDYPQMKDEGLKLVSGEFTGAGKVRLDRIQILFTERNLFLMDEVRELQLSTDSNRPKLSDLKSVEINGRKIKSNQIKALLVQIGRAHV